jgi:hypothetical protein
MGEVVKTFPPPPQPPAGQAPMPNAPYPSQQPLAPIQGASYPPGPPPVYCIAIVITRLSPSNINGVIIAQPQQPYPAYPPGPRPMPQQQPQQAPNTTVIVQQTPSYGGGYGYGGGSGVGFGEGMLIGGLMGYGLGSHWGGGYGYGGYGFGGGWGGGYGGYGGYGGGEFIQVKFISYSAERAEYPVHALPRVVTRHARHNALRRRARAQRGCAQRAQLIGCQLHTLRTCPRSQSIITLVTRYHADNA